MAWRIEQWGSPWPGGWMDWPAGLIDRMTIAKNVYDAFKSMSKAVGKYNEWTERHENYAQIVDDVLKLRAAHGE